MTKWPVGMIVPMQDPTPFSPFRPDEWQQALDVVAASGFDGVELAITNPTLLEVEEVAEALESRGLRLLSITTGQAAGLEGLSLSADDRGIRRRAVTRICDHMTLAKRFGAVVIVGSLRGADGNLDLLRESLAECAASQPSVNIALEPLNRYESRLLNSIESTVTLIESMGKSNLGVLFDTFHANIEEVSIPAAIACAGDRLVHVHLADSNRWVPGFGHFEFTQVWNALQQVSYRHSIVLEPLPLPSVNELLAAGGRLKAEWPIGG
ncbi:sugar phosphate isomerase/epimerase [Candidatus Bipolaricaulota bacterium]|nr:sugar phosphate isomerase/epimerase [Candidatus Bipolaricaulota bacterium]